MNYFDYSATTQIYPQVMETYQKVATQFFANPSSAHVLGEKSRQLMNQARQQIADILKFQSDEIFFASSGTEVNNWVLQSVVDALASVHPERKQVLISAVEHPSISRQIPLLESKGYQVVIIPVTAEGIIDLTIFETLLNDQVLLVSSMVVNNEVGAIQPINQMAAILQKYPQIIWHTDAVQATTTQLDLVTNQRIDLLTLSAHKFHSVRGAGVLAKRQRVASNIFLYGGGQEAGLRSSTENLAANVAMAKALRMTAEEQKNNQFNLGQFRQCIIETLEANNWQVFAKETASQHIICAALPPIPGEVLVHAFEEKEVYISTTSACSSRKHQAHSTLRAMGVADDISKSAIRISMGSTTTQEQVNQLLQAIETISAQFQQ